MPILSIVSSDDHIDLRVALPEIFERYLAKEGRERGPRIVDTDDGSYWVIDDRRIASYVRDPSAVSRSAITRAGLSDDGYRTITPARRLADMDLDGIAACAVYGAPGLPIDDPSVAGLCLRAYNDWAADFNAESLGRVSILANLPVHDVAAALAELRHAVNTGHRGVIFPVFETSVPVFDPQWEPLWAAVDEAGLPLSFHIGGGTKSIELVRGSWQYGGFTAVAPMQLDEPMTSMIFCGALERHPGIRLVLAESGLGWLPYLLERMDLEHVTHGATANDYRLEAKPSEVFARQVYATFEEDAVGVSLIPQIGADNVMWASDYPHQDSTFPHSREAVDRMFAATDPAIKRKITAENAARLYHFPVPEP